MAVPSDGSVDSNWNGSADLSEISSVGGSSIPSYAVPSPTSFCSTYHSLASPVNANDIDAVVNGLASLPLINSDDENRNSEPQ